jgi:PAS domain S-box-containing protein
MSLAQWSLLAQAFAAALACLVLALFVGYSRRLDVDDQRGWVAISIGFALLLFGMLVELARVHPELGAWFRHGTTPARVILDVLFGGQLLALLFLAFGFSRWMPAVQRLHEAELSLQESREELETRVAERTNELAEANRHIRRESEGLEHLSQELRESQRQMATLLGNLPGMAYRGQNDAERSMEFVSEGCVELTGYPPEQLLAGELIRYGELIDEFDRDRVRGAIRQALDRGDRFHLEYRLQTALGRTRYVWEQGTGVYDDDGELVAIEGLVVDITQRKLVEDRLQLASLIIDNALEGFLVTD